MRNKYYPPKVSFKLQMFRISNLRGFTNMARIMIVDDEPSMVLTIQSMLTAMGYHVIGQAYSGEQAVEIAAALNPDLILMDIKLPGQFDGITAAEQIRVEQDIAIVFISGYAREEYIERAKEVAPFGYVVKPFTVEQLQVSIEIALYKKEMERNLKDSHEALVKLNLKLEDEIAERKKTEEALKKTQRLLAETERLGKVGGWEFDLDTEKQTWTEEVYRIHEVDLPYTPTVRTGINFYTPASREIIEKAVQRAVNHGEPFDLELEISTAKGNLRSVHTIGKPDLDHRRVYGFFQDITEKKRLQTELLKAQKAESLATLAGGIAHDYNNLLSVIMGNLSMVQEETEPHSAMAGLLHEIEQASLKARDLTHQFLTLSKGRAPRKEPGAIENLLKAIPEQFQANAPIAYTFSIQDDLWPVAHDSRQMKNALTNVVKNAVEAMPQGGTIILEAENRVIDNKGKDPALPLSEGNYVGIYIKDEGLGIAEEHMDKVFDPYFSTKERGAEKGMGLGLPITRAVVQKHDGHILLNSTTGEGTTVTIYLPASDFGLGNSDSGLKGEEESKQSAICIPKSAIKRVLVMDDEESLRTLAQKMLERLGYEEETVKDGAEAIETYKKHMDSGEPFDMVMLDLTIKGGMGGDQAIKELIVINPEVKAIVCSGYFNDSVMANYEKYGFQGAMAKPYRKTDLEHLFKKVMG